ncbi:cupredoxin domain-containing protein [Aquincola sp. S2]|uniref:Cupredoxin domain-containing protein n=1 Tax=Pseudaquabacterium terrae TaxID=2732868 RepID=A0ABX2EPV1_9BURK|nr:plastocyanin/azurin family copper-binding protein [Aquabacterium terrae]NRF70677.1 cupredoxin domain-containing protein [Aquabacterium terrae]
MKNLLITGLLSLLPFAAGAAEHVVTQKDKAFSAKTLSIKVGDKVTFRNDDAFSHNVFSLSDAMPFDLGTYANGQAKSVTYAKAGKFEIECAIHPDMRLVISVAP